MYHICRRITYPGQNQELLRVNTQFSFLSWPMAGYGLLDCGGVSIIYSSHHKDKSRNLSVLLWHEPSRITSSLLKAWQHAIDLHRGTSSTSVAPHQMAAQAQEHTGTLSIGLKIKPPTNPQYGKYILFLSTINFSVAYEESQ